MSKLDRLAIIPVMLCFFVMGFVDLVGIASNYVKADLGLSDSVANIFPSLVFFWFLIFSVPTGMLMNKIGRKKTVLLSLIVTIVSLFCPSLASRSQSCCCHSHCSASATHSCRHRSTRSSWPSSRVETWQVRSLSDSSSRPSHRSLRHIWQCGEPRP